MTKFRHAKGLYEVLPGSLGEGRALSTADGGTALNTANLGSPILIPEGTAYIVITGNTYVTGVVAKIAKLPYLSVFKTADDGVSFTDYSAAAQDNDAATDVVLSSLDTGANGDYLYVGAHRKFAGLTVDVDAPNGNASVLTVEYWTGNAWVSIAATDGSISGGATMAIDGNITWTVPSNWIKNDVGAGVNGPRRLYWVRFKVSVALDSSTTLNSIWPMQRYSAFELIANQAQEDAITPGVYGFSALQAKMNAGTGNLVVNGFSGEEEF